MPGELLLSELADFYKVFADVTRIRILCVLLESEMCVCDLAEVLSMTQSAISHQLRVLKQMKLVKNRREGKSDQTKDCVLFSCRRTYPINYQPGDGAYYRVRFI